MGFDLVGVFRDALADDHPAGLRAEVTGPPATAYDQVAVFDGLDTRLLLASAGVVVVLLLLTYRSPVLWLLPMLSIAVAMVLSQAVIYLLARHADLPVDGQSGGIMPIMVFGVGTDYALLVISRYREELPHRRGPAAGPHDRRTPLARAGARLGRDRGARPVLPAAGRHQRHPQPGRRLRGRRGLRGALDAGDAARAAGPDRPLGLLAVPAARRPGRRRHGTRVGSGRRPGPGPAAGRLGGHRPGARRPGPRLDDHRPRRDVRTAVPRPARLGPRAGDRGPPLHVGRHLPRHRARRPGERRRGRLDPQRDRGSRLGRGRR